jgi:hypothetical protein
MSDTKPTEERVKELRDWLRMVKEMKRVHIRQWNDYDLGCYTDLLRLLDQHKPAPDVAPPDAERAALSLRLTQWSARLMRDLNWSPSDDDAYYKVKAILAAPAPRKVSREWFQKLATSIMYHHGTNEAEGIMWPEAKAMLRDLGLEIGPEAK